MHVGFWLIWNSNFRKHSGSLTGMFNKHWGPYVKTGVKFYSDIWDLILTLNPLPSPRSQCITWFLWTLTMKAVLPWDITPVYHILTSWAKQGTYISQINCSNKAGYMHTHTHIVTSEWTGAIERIFAQYPSRKTCICMYIYIHTLGTVGYTACADWLCVCVWTVGYTAGVDCVCEQWVTPLVLIDCVCEQWVTPLVLIDWLCVWTVGYTTGVDQLGVETLRLLNVLEELGRMRFSKLKVRFKNDYLFWCERGMRLLFIYFARASTMLEE